jgi:PEP-CTERM motif
MRYSYERDPFQQPNQLKDSTMTSLQRCTCISTLSGLCFAVASGAYAQVSTINSAIINPRVYNDVPGATLTTLTIESPVPSVPSTISFTEQNVSGSGFANRDQWHFATNAGAGSYLFQNNNYFSISMNVTLTGDPASSLRKEAGFVFNNPLNDGGQFILDTDAHEIVAFGGFLPFYAFPSTFVSGETVTMGISYANIGGVNSIMYSEQTVLGPPGMNSGWLALNNLELGVINNTTIGGYFQIVQDPHDPSNSGSAVFSKINISSVPEPSTFAFLGLGVLSLLLRRRRI